MPMTLDALEAEVLNLPLIDRAHLLDRLIASLDKDDEIQTAWNVEAKRRHDEITAGTANLIPGEQVFASLYAEFQ